MVTLLGVASSCDLPRPPPLSPFSRLSRMGQVAGGAGGLRSNSSRSMLNMLVSHGSAMLLTGMRQLIGRDSVGYFVCVFVLLCMNQFRYGYH